MGRWAKEGLADIMRQGFMKQRSTRTKGPKKMTRAQEIKAREARYEESVKAMGIRHEITADEILRAGRR